MKTAGRHTVPQSVCPQHRPPARLADSSRARNFLEIFTNPGEWESSGADRKYEEYVANEEKIVSVPAYLTDECIVHFTSKATALELDARASSALDTYLSENALEAKSSALESFSSVRLGSRQIRTMRSEEELLSSDSVICARFLEGKEERYSRYSQKH